MAHLDSVNTGSAEPNPYKDVPSTGIGKRPRSGPVSVRDPGPRGSGLGSGLVGDFVGDTANHGGSGQAVYAFAREDLDVWEQRLGRPLPNGFFGENLTTRDLDVNDARVGEIWRVGDVVQLRVTSPRIPCSTFRGWVGEPGWLRTFTLDHRPGAYLAVVTPGEIRAGDPVVVVHRPAHDVTVSLVHRATTRERERLPELLAAGEDLDPETRAAVERGRTAPVDDG